jgi:hypothetical protein
MSFFKTRWWRPASALIVLTLALTALSVGGRGTALAVATDGSVTVSPADLMIGAGSSGQLNVVLTPAAAGTSIWIIQIAYDPAVAQVAMSGGNPVCTGLDVSVALPGALGAGLCDVKDTNADGVPDTLVVFGAALKNNNGTVVGLTAQTTVATFTFNAVGAALAHTALTFGQTGVTAFLGPNGETPTPATSDGAIDITAGTPQIWGDVDCSGAVAPRDGQADLNHFLNKTELSQGPNCPAIGAAVTINGLPYTWGDVDCSGAVAPRDGQADLNHFLNKTELSQGPNCPAIGDPVTVS